MTVQILSRTICLECCRPRPPKATPEFSQFLWFDCGFQSRLAVVNMFSTFEFEERVLACTNVARVRFVHFDLLRCLCFLRLLIWRTCFRLHKRSARCFHRLSLEFFLFCAKLWWDFYGSGSDRIGQSEKFDEYPGAGYGRARVPRRWIYDVDDVFLTAS